MGEQYRQVSSILQRLFFGSISKEDEGIVESDSCSAVECRLVFGNELDEAPVFVFCTESTPSLIYGRVGAFSAVLSCEIGIESHCS